MRLTSAVGKWVSFLLLFRRRPKVAPFGVSFQTAKKRVPSKQDILTNAGVPVVSPQKPALVQLTFGRGPRFCQGKLWKTGEKNKNEAPKQNKSWT